MLYCFHLDRSTENAGSAVSGEDYQITKDGSAYDCFSPEAKFGTASVGGGSSGPAGTYYVTAPTAGEPLVPVDSDWTLSMWVNYRNGQKMWCNVGGFSIGANCFRIQRTNLDTYQLYCSQTDFIGAADASRAIPGGSRTDWVNLVFVFRHAARALDVYANGEFWGSAARDAFAGQTLTSISMGNYVLSSLSGGLTKDGRTDYSSAIDEVAVYNFAANGAQVAWLSANAPSTELYGVEEPAEIEAYYKSGYFGNSSNPLVLVSESGRNIPYTGKDADWTVVIDKDRLAAGTTTAWCSEQSYFKGNPIRIVKIIVRAPGFTLKPGVDAALFDGVEIEVDSDATLTLANEGARKMSVGAVTFSGEGTVSASSGVVFTTDVTIKGNVRVDVPADAFVAEAAGRRFPTLRKAMEAAGDDGVVDVLVNTLAGGDVPESWRGTVRFTGRLPDGFGPANYGNANSTVEFNGVSGGYLAYRGSFDGTLRLTNRGETPAWTVDNGFSSDNFAFGRLTGDGDLVDTSGRVHEQYSFADGSAFRGSLLVDGKRIAFGTQAFADQDHGGMIRIEAGRVATVAAGKTWTAANGIRIDGEIGGSGTLAGPVTFGADATVDGAEGPLAAGTDVTFGPSLKLRNVASGATVLSCPAKPANLESVVLKDAEGAVRPLWGLAYADGAVTLVSEKNLRTQDVWTLPTAEAMAAVPDGYTLNLADYLALDQAVVVLPEGTSEADAAAFAAKLTVVAPAIRTNARLVARENELRLEADPLTLYWANWRGTFWEHIGQDDVNGNHGLMRLADGTIQAHRPNDTVVFDGAHYTDANWHFDENLYIKDTVRPGTRNAWDLMIVDGRTLKLGFCGGRTVGQNVTGDFKIYIEDGAALELGFWGNTHHNEGLIRADVTFGGAGRVVFGADLGEEVVAEGAIRGTAAIDLNGKGLRVGGTVENPIIGLGTLSGSGTIEQLLTVPDDGTLDLRGELVFAGGLAFEGAVNVIVETIPDDRRIPIAAVDGIPAEKMPSAVRVVRDGKVDATFYTAEIADGRLWAVVDAAKHPVYTVTAADGYDFVSAQVTVDLNFPIPGLETTLVVTDGTGATVAGDWSATMDADGHSAILAGSADDPLVQGERYSYVVKVGDEAVGSGTFQVGNRWFAAQPAGGVTGGAWRTEPAVDGGAYRISNAATFDVAADKAAGERAVIEQVMTFAGAADAETLAEIAGELDGAKGALTLAEGPGGEGSCWKGYVGGEWVVLNGVPATLGEHVVRIEYDRTSSASRMRYLVDGVAVSDWFETSAAPFASVAYVGTGALVKLEATIEEPALVAYAGVKYRTVEAAVAAWKANGREGAIELLTNVFFAPEPGTYEIVRNGFSLRLTNDMVVTREAGTTIEVGFPPVVEGLTTGEEGFPVVIDGAWLGHALPWRTKKGVRRTLWTVPEGGTLAYWQAYVLGFADEDAASARAPVARVRQGGDPTRLLLADELSVRPARETGVVVTRLVKSAATPDGVDAAAGENGVRADEGLPAYDLTTMGGKVRYLKLEYGFEADRGQEE